MDKTAVVIIVIIVLAFALFFVWYSVASKSSVQPTPLPQGIVLFYGQGCPHCKDVEDFISQNNIKSKVNFTELEVWYNKSNAALLGQVAQKCSITSDQVGVPFLYDGKNCVEGGPDVINFFKNAAGIK